jgi:hypothetical protein
LSLPVNDILESDKQRPYILTVAHGTNSQLALVPVLILTGSFSVYENPGSVQKFTDPAPIRQKPTDFIRIWYKGYGSVTAEIMPWLEFNI